MVSEGGTGDVGWRWRRRVEMRVANPTSPVAGRGRTARRCVVEESHSRQELEGVADQVLGLALRWDEKGSMFVH